jgi:hypothetical protein
MSQITAEKFLKHVQSHQMAVKLDNGVYRHLKFMAPGELNQWFELVTWPGHLSISGDMGCYVFSRVEDMFRFFRDDDLRINAGYWEEKLQAGSTRAGVRHYDPDVLREYIKEHFDEWVKDEEVDAPDDLWQEIESQILAHSHDSEDVARIAVGAFDHDGFVFQDTFEWRLTRYSHHYLWCLYAIVWGIQQYDAQKQSAP